VDLLPEEIDTRLSAESRWHTCKIFEVLAAPFVNNQLPHILLLARSEERGPIGIYYILMEGGWVWVWLDRCKNRGWESYMHIVDVVLISVDSYSLTLKRLVLVRSFSMRKWWSESTVKLGDQYDSVIVYIIVHGQTYCIHW
jgi:hypothetical protein